MSEAKEKIIIPPKELRFVFSRSSGPGGQNVNKLNTRVSVLFDVNGSEGLSDNQKKLILKKLASRIDRDGFIRVSSRRYRTQPANRSAAVKRLNELLAKAIEEKPPRQKTTPTYASKQQRLKMKKQRGLLKAQRAKKHLHGDSDFFD